MKRFPRLSARLWVLVGILCGLIVVGIPLASLLLADSVAAIAVADRDQDAALGWVRYGERLRGESPQGLLIKARLARRRGALRQMEQFLKAASRADAPAGLVRRERMLADIQSGRLEKLEAQVKAWLVANDPDLPEIADAYANGLAACSRFDEALEMLGAWGQDYPTDPMPAFRAGRIHEFFEDFDSAADAYREAVARREDFLPARYALGRVLLRKKEPEKALREFESCRTGSTSLAAEVAIAECLAELGRTELAMQQLEVVLHNDGTQIQASYLPLLAPQECFVAARLLGTLAVNAGSHEQGLELLERALRYNPRDVAARYSHAVALRGLGRTQEAEAELAEIEENRAAMKRVNTLRNKINRDPDDVAARIELGRVLAEHESVENGLFWLRSAIVREPENQQARQLIESYTAPSTAAPGQ
ncbi:MAG: tetratricopeptide repeat protein [Pirellulales bacterium]|nr:tetratricopeptide repeat protein [Pirellulales bacterium]MBL7194602.1 tetratricopeptide repeat protein [Pirellulales bacterium]